MEERVPRQRRVDRCRALCRHALGRVVPVDLPEPADSFFRDYEKVSRAIGRTSPEFRRLVDLKTGRLHREGLPYLNSDEYIQAWEAIHREALETIEYMRKSDLAAIYAQVCDSMERRDLAMIKNIREYCAATAFTCGVFLVGAAHRKSLIEKLRAETETAPFRHSVGPRVLAGGLRIGNRRQTPPPLRGHLESQPRRRRMSAPSLPAARRTLVRQSSRRCDICTDCVRLRRTLLYSFLAGEPGR